MSEIEKICARCRICSWMPVQEFNPVLSLGEEWADVLLVDDLWEKGIYDEYILPILQYWFGDVPMNYTSTVRCDFDPEKITPENLDKAVLRCAVWTSLLAERRGVVVTTKRGLIQLGVKEEHSFGEVFTHERLGVVVVIPPIFTLELGTGKCDTYRAKIQRALKEVRVAA